MRHAPRDIHEVARPRDEVVLQLLAEPHHHLALDDVGRRLVLVVLVRASPCAGREAGELQAECAGARGGRGDPRGVGHSGSALGGLTWLDENALSAHVRTSPRSSRYARACQLSPGGSDRPVNISPISMSNSGARRKPTRSYRRVAATMCAAVCSPIAFVPRACARRTHSLASVVPTPRRRASASTPSVRIDSQPSGQRSIAEREASGYNPIVPTSRPASSATISSDSPSRLRTSTISPM